jgi:membrane protease YdiL (CAAX protease family)
MKRILRKIFLGPNGLRAGWRLLIFFAIVVGLNVVLQGVVVLLAKRWGLHEPAGLDPITASISDVLTLISTVVGTAVMARIEHRKLADYGLPGRNTFGREFRAGSAFGFVSVTILILLIYFAGGYSFGSIALHGSELVRLTALWVLASLLIGFTEEFLFRGYPQFTLATGIGFWPAAALISFLFGAAHYFTKPYEHWTDWASTSLIALLLCLSLRRTGNLRFAIGLHAAFDFAAIFVYSAPNGGQFAHGRLLTASLEGPDWLTGGPLGPEASLLAFPVIAMMFLVFERIYRRQFSDR